MNIYGTRIELNCPIGTVKNYMMPDKRFCNVYHQCQGNYGYIFVCEPGQAYDIASGSASCNVEELVNCAGKYILTETGQRAGKGVSSESKTTSTSAPHPPSPTPRFFNHPNRVMSNYMNGYDESMQPMPQQPPSRQQQQQYPKPDSQGDDNAPSTSSARDDVVNGIPFDCRNKQNGHWRDSRYCDVFHACISGEQRKTYTCAQVGDRTYFDEVTKR